MGCLDDLMNLQLLLVFMQISKPMKLGGEMMKIQELPGVAQGSHRIKRVALRLGQQKESLEDHLDRIGRECCLVITLPFLKVEAGRTGC